MIIYRPTATDCDGALKQIKNAISNEIGWIQLPTATLDDTEAQQLAETVIPLCRDNDIILMLENNVETVNRLHNHGVHLMPGSMHPAFVRERLGPHAIIGIQATAASDISSLKGVDIDYITLDRATTLPEASAIIEQLNDMSIDMPVVITGNYTPEDVSKLGIRGILRENI